MSNIETPEIFYQRFSCEKDYQNRLAHYLEDVFEVVVLTEVTKSSCSGWKGRSDIYIPIVNAVIECKIGSHQAWKARQQLNSYGELFMTDLLFLAIANKPETIKQIVLTLESLISSAKSPTLERLEKKYKLLSKRSYSYKTFRDSADYNLTKSIYIRHRDEANQILKNAKKILSKNHKLLLMLEREVKRLEDEWLKCPHQVQNSLKIYK